MNSWTTPEFWAAYTALPPAIQKTATKAYQLWRKNPRHPSIRFEAKGDYWSARVSRGYRAVAIQVTGGYVWFWIGNHDEYERIISNR